MGKSLSRSWVWDFDSPPEAIWPLLADTARFNEAAKLPKQVIDERPQADGSVLYLARARQGPFDLAWREKPVNWVSNRWFEHCRYFSKGPLERLCATFRLEPAAGGSRGTYRIEAAPANPLGAPDRPRCRVRFILNGEHLLDEELDPLGDAAPYRLEKSYRFAAPDGRHWAEVDYIGCRFVGDQADAIQAEMEVPVVAGHTTRVLFDGPSLSWEGFFPSRSL